MRKNLLWASPHKPTQEQFDSLVEMGIVSSLQVDNEEIFNSLSNIQLDTDLVALAEKLAGFAFVNGFDIVVQPAGSPAFHVTLGKVMSNFADTLKLKFAFSKRISNDVEQPDGSVKKTVVFKHEGWVDIV